MNTKQRQTTAKKNKSNTFTIQDLMVAVKTLTRSAANAGHKLFTDYGDSYRIKAYYDSPKKRKKAGESL